MVGIKRRPAVDPQDQTPNVGTRSGANHTSTTGVPRGIETQVAVGGAQVIEHSGKVTGR
jgi:hypothetical protein